MDDPLSQKTDGFTEGNELIFKYMLPNQLLPLKMNID